MNIEETDLFDTLEYIESVQQKISTNQLVNKVGQYLYKNIDGSIKAVRSSNTYDIYTLVYYQLDRLDQVPGRENEGYNDMHEMMLNISLTTFQNKIRVNIHEVSPDEYTFGYFTVPPEKLEDLQDAKKLIYAKVCKLISKHYEDYNFLF